MYIYHITTRSRWENLKPNGEYTPEAYINDGFIHCSTVSQVRQVANKFYRGQPGLIILEIDAEPLGKSVVFENLEGGSELFPHIYAPLPTEAAHQVYDLILESDLSFIFPKLFA